MSFLRLFLLSLAALTFLLAPSARASNLIPQAEPPVSNSAKPVSNSAKPVSNGAKPVSSGTKPVSNGTKSAAAASQRAQSHSGHLLMHRRPITIPPEQTPFIVQYMGRMCYCTSKIWYRDNNYLHVETTLLNRTNVPCCYTLHVAFFDKDGGLVCSASRTEIFAISGYGTKGCGFDMRVPRGYMSAITNYEIVLYDSTQVPSRD